MASIYDKFDNISQYDSIRERLLKNKVHTHNDKLDSEKIERTLSLSPYKTTLKYYENADAMVRVILNLLFLKPGTYPNSPEMGIDIEQYKFEFLDTITISQIEENINSQIQTYLSDSVVGYVELKKLTTTEEIKRTIIISITVKTSSGMKTFDYSL